MGTLVILQQMAVIAILVAIGIYLHRSAKLNAHSESQLSALVMDVVNPALILSIVISGEVEASHKELITALGISAAFYAVLIFLGLLLPHLMRIEAAKQKFYNMMIVYTNVGFIGIPVGRAVLDGNGMLYVIVCNMMYSLLFYTHGILTLAGKGEKISLKKILSPGTLAAILTLVFAWYRVSLPELVSSSITYIGNATIFLSMALLGASLAKYSFASCLKEKKLWLYILVRMIAVPFLLVWILRMLGFQREIVRAFCFLALMPVANLPLIQAEKIGEDTGLLSKGIALTTICSFATVTLFMSII